MIARRGGYCFEQNGVFERVLRELGFNVRSLLGRVVLSNPPALPPRTHRLLLVELEEEKWIADVGFGGQTLTAPIRLVPDLVQTTPHGEYRLLQEVMIGCCSLIIISTGSRCTVLISASSNKAIM
ncbi:Putative N-hydroxyarylamine O-acetyltransferase [Escherichia coli]|uniref:N-hydroxyarylamine O-acetyltransferase n=1 Tax=Escherichia coli TaxID=562 RepID=A0A377E423_ECOLX|nr:Putative N-hydroxyarylamine O-acetyltransferase [Escherichia coli]